MPSPIFFSKPAASLATTTLARGAQLGAEGVLKLLKCPGSPARGALQLALGQTICGSLLVEVVVHVVNSLVQSIIDLVALALGEDARLPQILAYMASRSFGLRYVLVPLMMQPELTETLFLKGLETVDLLPRKNCEDENEDENENKNEKNQKRYGVLSEMKQVRLPHEPLPNLALQDSVQAFKLMAVLSCLSMLVAAPRIGGAVIPLVVYFTFRSALGTPWANLLIFTTALGYFPQEIFAVAVAYLNARALSRNLVEPYFQRLPFSHTAKETWLANRQGALTGFGLLVHVLLRVPGISVLVYACSAVGYAWVVSSLSDPPPSQEKRHLWTEEQVVWSDKN